MDTHSPDVSAPPSTDAVPVNLESFPPTGPNDSDSTSIEEPSTASNDNDEDWDEEEFIYPGASRNYPTNTISDANSYDDVYLGINETCIMVACYEDLVRVRLTIEPG